MTISCAVAAAVALAPSAGATPARPARPAAPAALPRTGSSAVATAGFLASLPGVVADPAAPPAGVNVGCRPSATHPYPVVLVNGTFEVMQDSFDYLGPRLARAGYCVFGYNYGATVYPPQVQATAPVDDSVQALAAEVRTVTRATGSSKVDLIGFSQGGLLTELYTKFGGAASVHSVTALAPTTHGTTLLGLGTLAAHIPGARDVFTAVGCPACNDQIVGSAVIAKLNKGPIAQPGVRYTVIDTRYEEVVTPAGSSFIHERGVTNEYVQSFDPTDVDEHVVLPFNPVTGDRVLAALHRAGS